MYGISFVSHVTEVDSSALDGDPCTMYIKSTISTDQRPVYHVDKVNNLYRPDLCSLVMTIEIILHI